MTTILVHCKDIEEPFWRHREAAEAVAGGCECSRCTPAAVYCVSDTQHRKRFHSSVRDPPGKGISCLNQIIGSMLEGCFSLLRRPNFFGFYRPGAACARMRCPVWALGLGCLRLEVKLGNKLDFWVGSVASARAMRTCVGINSLTSVIFRASGQEAWSEVIEVRSFGVWECKVQVTLPRGVCNSESFLVSALDAFQSERARCTLLSSGSGWSPQKAPRAKTVVWDLSTGGR